MTGTGSDPDQDGGVRRRAWFAIVAVVVVAAVVLLITSPWSSDADSGDSSDTSNGTERTTSVPALRGAYGRDSQPSHTMLEEHIAPLRSLAILVPSIFLLVAAFLVNIVLSRVVATLKEELAAWRTRSLADVDAVYLYLDAFALRVRSAGKVVSVPVLGVGQVLFAVRLLLLGRAQQVPRVVVAG